ncbi:ADP-ribosylation factor 6-like [Ciona intestinalis]|uniref:ADP-ribosylation factor-like protein 14 n=1 Tax=Ciona intestinalis TaxID=7719 RepID=F6XGT0_CIOIN|nr:ADP-ribosylation factor 6-like [Ciona intestinalis]|eukprot:XP_002131839.1 ADP-ribosylation factor 6-like [Ciona intestinalis]
MGALASKLEAMFSGFASDPVRVLMLGLDCAGKTTILYRLKLNNVVKTIPTIGFNVETVTPCKGLTITVWDVGGQTKLRRLWRHYYQESGGLIFVVDSADQSRFHEAKQELFNVLKEPEMARIPVLILANKQDISLAQPIEVLIEQLGLGDIPAWQRWNIQPCSATKGDGVIEGMQSFSRMIKEFKKLNK